MPEISSWFEWVNRAVVPLHPLFTFLSYGVGPIFALLAFIWGRKDRRELIDQALEQGRLKQEAFDARRRSEISAVDLETSRAKIASERAEVDRLNKELKGITEGSQELWKLRPAREFEQFKLWQLDRGAKLVTIGNLKGGVGKTTIAANLAAYVIETLGKRVLLVDLDYQASLSNMMLLAIGSEEVESKVEALFDPDANLATVTRCAVHLVPMLNRGWLIPANYSFAATENLLLLNWLLDKNSAVDVRYRLAHVLLNPDVRRNYDLIIFDMPPRMTLGSVNALVASHYFVVPTGVDKLSAEAVSTFISNMKAIKEDLMLDLELAAIIGGLSRNRDLNEKERSALELAREGGMIWKNGVDFVLPSTIPRKAAIGNAAGEEVAYLLQGNDGQDVKSIFNPLFSDLCSRIGING